MLKIFKRKARYGHPGDSRAADLVERQEVQADWLESEMRRRENEIRIARIEGMARVLMGRSSIVGDEN